MRTKLFLGTGVAAILALAVFTPPAQAQNVVGSAHDLSTNGGPGATTNVDRVCVFCHTPHQAALAAGQYPLWNHELSAVADYGVYSSITLDATPVNIGGAVAGTAGVSNLCMSCHDGTVAVHSLYNDPNEATPVTITPSGNVDGGGLIINNPNVGTDLSDDHPINFIYDNALAALDPGLNDPATTPAVAALLFGGRVECASCHDPHDRTFPPFMIMDNTASGLCTTCHIK